MEGEGAEVKERNNFIDLLVGLIIAVVVAVVYNANLDEFQFLFDVISDLSFDLLAMFFFSFPGITSLIFYYVYSRNLGLSLLVGFISSIVFTIIFVFTTDWVLP